VHTNATVTLCHVTVKVEWRYVSLEFTSLHSPAIHSPVQDSEKHSPFCRMIFWYLDDLRSACSGLPLLQTAQASLGRSGTLTTSFTAGYATQLVLSCCEHKRDLYGTWSCFTKFCCPSTGTWLLARRFFASQDNPVSLYTFNTSIPVPSSTAAANAEEQDGEC